MGYSSNPAVVVARAHLFEELAAGHPQVWTCEPDPQATKRLAKQLYETLYIASQYPDQFPELAAARQMYSIHVVQPGRIEARLRPTPVVVQTERGTVAPSLPTPTHGIVSPQTGFKHTKQVGLVDAESIIESWREHLPSNDPLYLANTVLELPELLKLYTFCQRNKPRLMLLVGENHITLSLYEAETANLAAWHPPETAEAASEEFDFDKD